MNNIDVIANVLSQTARTVYDLPMSALENPAFESYINITDNDKYIAWDDISDIAIRLMDNESIEDSEVEILDVFLDNIEFSDEIKERIWDEFGDFSEEQLIELVAIVEDFIEELHTLINARKN